MRNRKVVSLIRLMVGPVVAWAWVSVGADVKPPSSVHAERTRVEHWLKNETGRTGKTPPRRGPFSDAVMLGNAYEHGKGVKRDLAESVRWYRRAVAQSNDWGRAKLAALYVRGAVMGMGCAEAIPLLRTAASNNNELAYLVLARMNEEGRGMPTNVAAAVDWYTKAALSSSTAWRTRQDALDRLVVLTDTVHAEDVAHLTGKNLLDICYQATNDAQRLRARLLFTRMKGRTLTFDRLTVTQIEDLGARGITLSLVSPEHYDKRYGRDRKRIAEATIRLTCTGTLAERTFFLNVGDDVRTVVGRVGGEWGELTALDFTPTDEPKPLPAFDPATVTEETLYTLATSCGGFRRFHYRQLAERLKGRRLEFSDSDIRITGWGIRPDSSNVFSGVLTASRRTPQRTSWKEAGIGLYLSPASFRNPEAGKALEFVAESRSSWEPGIKAIRGRVEVAPETQDPLFRSASALYLVDVEVVFDALPERLPKADYAKISGDELVQLFKTFENGVPRHLWQELRSVLKGRRLEFTNQWIQGGGTSMSTKGLTLRFGWRPPGSENVVRRPDGAYSQDGGGCYSFSAKMPWEVLDACSRIPVQGDGVRRISGTVSGTWRPFGLESILQLENVSVEMAYMTDCMPSEIPENMTGDEIVDLLQRQYPEIRSAQAVRLFRKLEGRRLTFSTARMSSWCKAGGSGSIHVSFDVGLGRMMTMNAIMDTPTLERKFEGLVPGEAVRNLSGIFEFVMPEEPGIVTFGLYAKGFRLRGASFTAPPPSLDLPPFDAQSVTGDELVAAFANRTKPLSRGQVRALYSRLAGRRLGFTFAGRLPSSSSYRDGRCISVTFRLGGLAVKANLREPLKDETYGNRFDQFACVTGRVAEDVDESDLRGGRMEFDAPVLVLEDAVLEPKK